MKKYALIITVMIFFSGMNSLLFAKCGLTEKQWSVFRDTLGCSTCQCAADKLLDIINEKVDDAQQKQSILKYYKAIDMYRELWIIEMNKSNKDSNVLDGILIQMINLYNQVVTLSGKQGDRNRGLYLLQWYYLDKYGPWNNNKSKKVAEDEAKILKNQIKKDWPNGKDLDKLTKEEIKGMNLTWWK